MTISIDLDLVRAAAAALASALPVPSTLTAGEPVAATEFSAASSFPLPLDPGAAVVCRVGAAPGSSTAGELAVIVDSELVHALATSPLGALELTSAVQPALDAASHATTGSAASASQQFEVDMALSGLLVRPGAHLVPLSDPYGLVVATMIVAFDAPAVQAAAFVQSEPSAPAFTDPRAAVPASSASAPAEPRLRRQNDDVASLRQIASNRNGLDLLRDVAMEVTVELGRTRMTVRELLSLTPGAVVELDRAAGSPADLLVNGTLIARGEVVVVDEDFGIRITEIVASGADPTMIGGNLGSGAA